MNAISQGGSQNATSRIVRGLGAAAISTILIVGLSGCMTGRVPAPAPAAKQNAAAPLGVDLRQSADRIEEQLARQAAVNRANSIRFAGVPADRVEEQLAREAGAAEATDDGDVLTNPYPGMPADRVEEMLAD